MDVQGDDVSADLGLRRHHGRLLHLLPVGSQVGQPQVVVNKLKAAEVATGRLSERAGDSGGLERRFNAPFPRAQVEDDEALVLVRVDVVKHADGSSFELQVDVLSGAFPRDVEQGL